MTIDLKEIVDRNRQWMDHREGFEHILEVFQTSVEGSDLPIVEVGVNQGGSSRCFLDFLSELKQNNWLISVDPYGSITYHDGCFVNNQSYYDNKRYRDSMQLLHAFANEKNLNYVHFKMTSEDFMNSFDHLKIYDQQAKKLEKFSFIFLDGSHDPEIVKKEISFFCDHVIPTGAILVDDWHGDRFVSFVEEFTKQQKAKGIEPIFDGKINQRMIIRFKSHETPT